MAKEPLPGGEVYERDSKRTFALRGLAKMGDTGRNALIHLARDPSSDEKLQFDARLQLDALFDQPNEAQASRPRRVAK
jgi:hypothetical protein